MLLCVPSNVWRHVHHKPNLKAASSEANALCDGLILVPSNVTCLYVVLVKKYCTARTETISLNCLKSVKGAHISCELATGVNLQTLTRVEQE